MGHQTLGILLLDWMSLVKTKPLTPALSQWEREKHMLPTLVAVAEVFPAAENDFLLGEELHSLAPLHVQVAEE